MRFQGPRGTEDVLPDRSAAWQWIEGEFRQLTGLYGYREIRTPTFEDYDLFVRTSGETSDVVSKEMYDFIDKGERHMALKPEATAPTMRALIEHNLCPQGTVTRLSYVSSPTFRYDRPQKGRLREHHQCGAEIVGCASPAADAEVIEVGVRFLERLGLTGLTVKINSIGRAECRGRYREALLAHAATYLEGATEELRQRVNKNPLRMLDMKDPVAQEAMRDAPSILNYLEPECTERFEQLQALLDEAGIAYLIAPDIVRGLDYYTETVFETQSTGLGAQATVFAGGRYDNLVKELGGASLPAVGFGMGVERLLILLDDAGKTPTPPGPTVFVAYAEEAQAVARELCRKLRLAGITALMDLETKSMKSQFRQADRLGSTYVAILGEDELAANQVSLKNLSSGEQRLIGQDELVEHLR